MNADRVFYAGMIGPRSNIKKLINLAYLAFNAGYPDVNHLSHSVRQVFGMTPAVLFKGCSKRLMYGHAVPTPTAT